MAEDKKTPAETIAQLELARKAALTDPIHYNQILPGVLSIIGPGAYLEVRRWVAEFTAETFASPSLPAAQKEQLSLQVLPILRTFLEATGEDTAVVKSAVQTSASLYPLIFKRLISHPSEDALWQDLSAIKLNILQRMDGAAPPIRICCIKFVQKVVQVQTPGTPSDPRRPDMNDISLALVPRSHSLLPLTSLEAEAFGLLDRLLGVLQESTMDPLIVDSSLNCLAALIRTRPSIVNKIMSAVLSFNPLRQATSPLTPKAMVSIRSMERTTVALLKWFRRSFRNHPLDAKVATHIARLEESRKALFADSAGTKRPAEAMDGVDEAKRQRLAEPPQRKFPPMPPPPNSLAQLFTLTDNMTLQNLDVTEYISADSITNIAFIFLTHTYPEPLNDAVDEVRRRYAHLKKISQPTPVPDIPLAGPTGIDDEDDYDPELISPSDTAVAPAPDTTLEDFAQSAIDLGPFELPKPPPLTPAEVAVVSGQTVGHIFELVASHEVTGQPVPKQKLGLNRLAASTNDRDSWVTIMIRLATRASAGLDYLANSLTGEGDAGMLVKSEEAEDLDTANRIRQTLFMYILDDFRPRLNIAISWLTEEWYADRLKAASYHNSKDTPNYNRWSIRLIDRLLPYLDARDKNILIRFLSEIPTVDREMLGKVKTLARDPERVSMCMMAMQYLILMRPPAKEIALDAIESIWHEGDAQTKAAAMKVLNKYRPGWNAEIAPPKAEGANFQEAKESADIKPNGVKGPPQEPTDPRRRRIAVAKAES